MLKSVTLVRKFTTKLPEGSLYLICFIFSPLIYSFFTLPAKLLNKLKKTRSLSNKLPFNFGRHPFDLAGDLFDRFRTPIEFRFGKSQLTSLLENANFKDIKLTKIPDIAGWVVWARK